MAERKKVSTTANETANKKSSFSRLYRSEKNKMIAGVCGGLGEFFGIDPSIVRLLFILIIIFGGSGILLYIVLWIILPTESAVKGTTEDHIKANVEEMRSKAETVADSLRGKKERSDSRALWGLLILVIGAGFLISNFGFFGFFDWSKFWPIILIVFGIFLLTKSR